MAWIAAWLLDPMVSVVLIAVLAAEQVTARYQVATGPWIRRTKWFAFAATYVMNTWVSWAGLHLAGIVLHSVPPLLVYLASEAAPVLRDRLTEAVHTAARQHHAHQASASSAAGEAFTNTAQPASPATPVNTGVNATPAPPSGAAAVHEPTNPVGAEDIAESVNSASSGQGNTTPNGSGTASASGTTGSGTGQANGANGAGGRKLRGEYLAEALAAWHPGIEVTPAWVRQVTGCSRGLSTALAEQVRTQITEHQYPHTTNGKAA